MLIDPLLPLSVNHPHYTSFHLKRWQYVPLRQIMMQTVPLKPGKRKRLKCIWRSSIVILKNNSVFKSVKRHPTHKRRVVEEKVSLFLPRTICLRQNLHQSDKYSRKSIKKIPATRGKILKSCDTLKLLIKILKCKFKIKAGKKKPKTRN